MTFWIRVRKWLQRHFGIVVFLAVYCAALFVLLPFRSLWLDEILDLIAARSPSLPSLLAAVRANEGGVPLGYILHALSMAMFGVSAFSGRLPSVIASVFGCIGVFLLAHRAGMRRPIIAVIAFAIFPLQFRYALEARGYEIALCCSIWSSVFFFRILDRPQTSRAWCLYVLSIVAGVYSQPFSMFVPVSHFIWLSVSTGRQRRLELVGVGSVILLAGLLFLPWYLYTTLAPADYPRGTLESRSILMVLRELVGAGYIGTILVLSGAVFAIRRPLKTRHDRSFWLLLIVTPIAGVVTADVAIHYFFAIRQVIFVLPPLAILLALGVESLYDPSPTGRHRACADSTANPYLRERRILSTSPGGLGISDPRSF